MDTINELLSALWQQDFQTLSNPKVMWLLYAVLFTILVLENGLLPAAFLPGDSLLFLTGILISKGSLNFSLTIVILTIGASLGFWLGYLQGRWLGKTKTVQNWLTHVPEKYHIKTQDLLHEHGLLALLIARFTAFVRTLMPLLVGISGMDNRRFQLINWLSGLLWVSTIICISFFFSRTPLFIHYQDKIIFLLTLLPIGLLIIGLVSSLVVVWHKNRKNKK